MNAVFGVGSKRLPWQTVAMFALGFWLSGSLIVDFVLMPCLYTAGMMNQASFATTGYSIFWIFNRIELLCAAVVLVSLLALRGTSHLYLYVRRWAVFLAAVLLTIAIIYTYIMTPQMSALAVQLNLFEPATGIPSGMVSMQGGYWLLETIKLTAGAIVLSWCYRDCRSLT